MATNFEEANQPQSQPSVTTEADGASPEQQQQQAPLTAAQIQEAGALCNWCRNPLIMSGSNFDESNFIDTGKQWHGSAAVAAYCDDCSNDSFRTSQPKAVIDRITLQEENVSNLP
jgi:hypothetical protein